MFSITSSYFFQIKSFCKFLNSGYSDADKIRPAVYTARALLRGFDNLRQEYMNECEKVYPANNSNRQSNDKSDVLVDVRLSDYSVLPNPASNSIIINH